MAVSYAWSHIETQVVIVATRPATPATMTTALPTRVPVPEGAVAYAATDIVIVWRETRAGTTSEAKQRAAAVGMRTKT